MKVWVTGAGGLLGQALMAFGPPAPDWEVRGWTHEELELTDYRALREAFKRERPDLVIHAAALSRPRDCEGDPDRAWAVNVGVTALLADLMGEGRLIFISSEQVFDGRSGPYAENAPVCPINVYGQTKAEAERHVLARPQNVVVRLALTYGHSRGGQRAFNEEWEQRWRRGETLRLFTDEYRCPIPAPVAAQALWVLAAEPGAQGIYHLAGAERLSRWEIGQLLAQRVPGALSLIQPATLQEWVGPPRPPDLSLTCERLQALLPFALPAFSTWLAAHPPAG
ncbi:NAD(P)-dependent oxidoreductase [Fontisphaera persica]|uniref:SDR family oxidoreductase n=1 Tax=Fontisphaera persica TaxID=2974023 RepID=UPI0024BFB4B9|nr:NAD(P)-dependent oxidoreductase [Fontisphaera persica]WCJ60825.1 NAD(P)-dependent oxidoreductase [Fontisphaera persica]